MSMRQSERFGHSERVGPSRRHPDQPHLVDAKPYAGCGGWSISCMRTSGHKDFGQLAAPPQGPRLAPLDPLCCSAVTRRRKIAVIRCGVGGGPEISRENDRPFIGCAREAVHAGLFVLVRPRRRAVTRGSTGSPRTVDEWLDGMGAAFTFVVRSRLTSVVRLRQTRCNQP